MINPNATTNLHTASLTGATQNVNKIESSSTRAESIEKNIKAGDATQDREPDGRQPTDEYESSQPVSSAPSEEANTGLFTANPMSEAPTSQGHQVDFRA